MTTTSLSLLDRLARRSERPPVEYEKSWQRLVDVYSPLLRQWIGRYYVQSADADDLVQDVLLAVSRELPQFEHNQRQGAFRKWLRTILVHRLQNYWRSRKYRPAAVGGSSLLDELRQLEDESSSISRIWNDEHDKHVLTQLMSQIRPRFQDTTWEAFRRQMFGGESADAVAAALDVRVHTVYVAKSRVLNALRQEAAGLVDSLHDADDAG